MSLSSYLTKPLGWLRAGCSARAPRHGYVPLLALMPSPAAQTEDPLDKDEHPADYPGCGALA
jgi:hypothetical protein